MVKINSNNGSGIIINGNEYTGRQVIVNNGRVFVDGVEQGNTQNEQVIITISGSVESVEVENGSVNVSGNAHRVKTMSGDVRCSSVSGNVNTMSGDVICDTINGGASTMSGNIIKK